MFNNSSIKTPKNFHSIANIVANFHAAYHSANIVHRTVTVRSQYIFVIKIISDFSPYTFQLLLAGKMPSPFMACYAATKHAIEGFFGCLREEFIMSNNQISITLCTLSFVSKYSQACIIFYPLIALDIGCIFKLSQMIGMLQTHCCGCRILFEYKCSGSSKISQESYIQNLIESIQNKTSCISRCDARTFV